MSFLGRPTPPVVIWLILIALGNAIAIPLYTDGHTSWAFGIWSAGGILLVVTYVLWWYYGWSF